VRQCWVYLASDVAQRHYDSKLADAATDQELKVPMLVCELHTALRKAAR
jgi:hypothetical protein